MLGENVQENGGRSWLIKIIYLLEGNKKKFAKNMIFIQFSYLNGNYALSKKVVWISFIFQYCKNFPPCTF